MTLGCGSFSSQEDAQIWFDANLDFGENVDTNNDGIACGQDDNGGLSNCGQPFTILVIAWRCYDNRNPDLGETAGIANGIYPICRYFSSREDAQLWYEANRDFGQKIDLNNDGIACHIGDPNASFNPNGYGLSIANNGDLASWVVEALPKTESPYREPSMPSADRDLCRLSDQRGIPRDPSGWTYQAPMVSGVDYTHRNVDSVNGFVHLQAQYSTGFPLVEGMLPSVGTLPVAFFAIDFLDSPGSDFQLEEIQRIAKELNEYWDFQSGGRFQMDFRFGDRLFNIPVDSGIYGLQLRPSPTPELTEEVVRVVDPYFDFTGIEDIFMLIPKTNYNIAQDWHKPPFPNRRASDGGDLNIQTDESIIKAWSGNGWTTMRDDWVELGGVAMFYIHETLHDMGISDLYLWTDYVEGRVYKDFGSKTPMGEWDVMQDQNGNAREIIAWHKWLLGWLDDEQIYCLPSDSINNLEVSLSPLTRQQEGFKAVVIPLSEKKMIVIESRRAENYSASAGNMQVGVLDDGVLERGYLNDFGGADGLLVYTYDTSTFWGEGHARMQIPDDGRAQETGQLMRSPLELGWDLESMDARLTDADFSNPSEMIEIPVEQLDPLLRLGDSITVDGITIELLEWGQSDRVRISK